MDKKTSLETPAPEERETDDKAAAPESVAAIVKRLVLRGKKRGYLTLTEINDALPPLSSEEIEDIMTTITDGNINIIELGKDKGKIGMVL